MAITDIIYHKIIGTITPDEEQELDAWLSAEIRHRQLYEKLLEEGDVKGTYQLYASLHPDKRWQELIGSLSEKDSPNTTEGSRFRLKPLFTAAISMAAAALLFFGLWQWQHTPTLQPAEPVAVSQAVTAAIAQSERAGRCQAAISVDGNSVKVGSYADSILTALVEGKDVNCEVSTAKAKEFWMTLPDGSRVHLDSNSKLAYTTDFGHDSRTVWLHGNAFFFVAKNAKLPFIIKTACGDVKEYGTEFNVETTATHTSVVLVSGSVGLLPKDGGETRLLPGYKGDMRPHGQPSVRSCDVKPYIAWNEGRFSFNDTTLDELMAVLAHWYDIDVEFADKSLKGKRITGILSRYDDINSSLNAIAVVAQVKMSVKGRKVFVAQ